MIPTSIQFILFLILAAVVISFLPFSYIKEGQQKRKILALKAPSIITRSKAKKETNKKKVLETFDTMPGGKLTSFDLQLLLDVSDATATRYLEELEKEGKVRQAGGIGRHVYYEKVS